MSFIKAKSIQSNKCGFCVMQGQTEEIVLAWALAVVSGGYLLVLLSKNLKYDFF